ncbi:PREDICTED: rho GTPase-activating protein 44 [Ficedula albicollis]|uniref:rho GTPase-activating protein 44 n=1 Tax=Ficedula albicollis TaxID=59894 RepID=UPI0007AD79E9|nr:PREDICTED: rho GTPase-activating protein 44 [Ficedula albicollis]
MRCQEILGDAGATPRDAEVMSGRCQGCWSDAGAVSRDPRGCQVTRGVPEGCRGDARAEKTEVLSEDLLQVEKRLELVKQVSHSTHKKLTACLQGQQGLDADKRSKKLPLTTLAQCLMEGSAVLGDDSLLGKMLRLCGEAEDKLAQELIHFELQVERDVIEPLFVLAEVEIPNIQKQRKHLAKLVLDMDSSRTRWQQSVKSSGLASNLQSSGAKADALREEMEEAANRVEICRDQLSADMYNFVAKEVDYANYFQTLIEVQAEYHRKSLALLQNFLPQIKAQQEAWVEKPSFGKPLEEHLAVSGREIAFPVEACVTMLLECGMQEEGLFRVAPSASKLKKLKAALDCCVVDVQEYSADPHAIAGALKSYLRELPEPLMTFELYEEWIQASNIPELEKRLQALWNACEKLPKANYNNIRYVIKFLAKLTEYQDTNKMTPSNVAIVLGPNLLWPQAEGNMTEMMTTLSLQIVSIIEPLIQHADWFFPGDIEFNVTGNYGSPLHVNHNANYSSMPSPDMEHGERRQHEQARRPLSVATDNMMLEFYKKDGLRKIQSMGVRVMDTSWVARRGTSAGRKATSAPPTAQPPAPPLELPPTTFKPPELSPGPPPAPAPAAEQSPHSLRKGNPGGTGRRGGPGGGRVPQDGDNGPEKVVMPLEKCKCPQDMLVLCPPVVPALLEGDNQGDALELGRSGRDAFSIRGGCCALIKGHDDTACLWLWSPCHFTRAASPCGSPGRRDSSVTCAWWDRASWDAGSVTALARVGSPEQRAVVIPLVVALTRCQPRGVSPSLCPPAGLLRFEVPSLHVSPDAALCRDPPEAAQRLSGPSLTPRQEEEEEEEEEEESESTAL